MEMRAIWKSADFQTESSGGQCEWSHRQQKLRAWQERVKGDNRATEEAKGYVEISPFRGTKKKAG